MAFNFPDSWGPFPGAQFPYTQTGALNMDWVLWVVKNLIAEWKQTAQDWETQQEAFKSLKSYVENYFNNLDVQDEINNKIEEMLASGELNTIIGAFLFSRVELDNYESDVVDNSWNTAISNAVRDCATYHVPLHITPGKTYHFSDPVTISDVCIFSEAMATFDFESEFIRAGDAFSLSGNCSSISNLAIINTTSYQGFACSLHYVANRTGIKNLFVNNCNNGVYIERMWYCPVDTLRIIGKLSPIEGVGLLLGDSGNSESGVNGICFTNVQINYFETGLSLAENVNTNSTQFNGITIENISGSAIAPRSHGNVGFSGLYCEALTGVNNVLFSDAETYITLSNVVVRAQNATTLAPDSSYRIILLDRMYNPQNLPLTCFTTLFSQSLNNQSIHTYSNNMVSSSTRVVKTEEQTSVTIPLSPSLYSTAYICILKMVPYTILTNRAPGAFAVLLYERNWGRFTPLVYATSENDNDTHMITFAGNTSSLTINFSDSFASLGMHIYIEFFNPTNLMV